MNVTINPRVSRFWRQVPPRLPYQIVETALIALIAVQAARLIWVAVAPVGPVGAWQASLGTSVADEALLARFDPFFRLSGAAGPAVVTSLAIKLFGTRIDTAMGRGSAIIATPDGVQASYAVGDEIMPGVKLKSVTFDGVTIDRGGVSEEVFLDQSVVVPVAQPGAAPAAAAALGAPPPGIAIMNEIAFAPKTQRGRIVGFTVSPKGSGAAFRAAGLQDNDVVTAINGQAMQSVDDAAVAIGRTPPTGAVTLSVLRGDVAVTLSVPAR